MRAALAASGEARVLLPLGFPERGAHSMPVMLVSGNDQDPTVLAGEHATGSRIGPAPLGLGSGSVVGGDGDLGQAVARVCQADVDTLPLSRNVSLVERCQSSNRRVQRGGAVDDGDTGANRRHALFAGDHGDAGHRLADGVVAYLVAIGTELPVRRDI